MQFYLSFEGRVSLGQFWLRWMLPLLAFSIVVGFVLGLTGAINVEAMDPANPYAAIPAPLWILWLLLIWPSIAVAVKRLHDIGWTGWLVLLSLIPLANLVIFVVTWFFPGNDGTNKYGPDPRQPAVA